MYLTISNCAISVVLFWHVQDGEQRLVYYVSKAMVDNTLFPSRIDNHDITCHHQKASSILSSSSSNDFDKPTIVGHITQTKYVWMNDEMGNWVKTVRLML